MRTLAIILCLALAGCGGGSPQVDKLAPDAVILAFGDSLTFGTGAGPSESYPAQLERRIGRKVVNAGVPGELSATGLERLPQVLDEVRPALLLLCHGGNDFLRRMDDSIPAANLRAMLELARSRGIPVVLLATPKPTLPPSVPPFFGELARQAGVHLVEAAMKEVLSDRSLKSDLVHPNARGYGEVAAAVEKALKRAGAV
ncbi:MAG TPA: GDSL-type esterase/lipase family protein [Usitatibacter sp.]|nr:GDSL-type esterase/lipase family protein [Usitatibacter sp.]